MNSYQLVFPEWKSRFMTFSYDDGKVSDRKLVALFNKYNMKATFHLSSNKFGKKGERLDYLEKEEIRDLYLGHEISCHGHNHISCSYLTESKIAEILENRKILEEISSKPIRGFAYPMGVFSERDYSVLNSCGIIYARTARSSHRFDLPDNPFTLNPTCHHDDPSLYELSNEFFSRKSLRKLSCMIVWGHSYEFEMNSNFSNFESYLQYISEQEDRDGIWFTTLEDLILYKQAFSRLVFSANGNFVYNPTDKDIWLIDSEENKFLIRANSKFDF